MIKITRNFTRTEKIFCSIFIFIGAFIISNAVSVVITSYLCGGIMINNLTAENTTEIFFLKISQLLSSVILFILPPIILAILFQQKVSDFINLKNSPNILKYLLIVLFMLTAFPLLSLITEWNEAIKFPEQFQLIEKILRIAEETNAKIINLIISENSIFSFILNIIVIALIPAIGEEIVFRGVLQKYLGKLIKNQNFAILITAFIFSAIHLSFFGFFPRFILGIFLGYLAYNFKSLYPSIFAHFFNNAMAVCMSFYFVRTNQEMSLEEMNFYPDNNIIFIITILVAIGFGFLLFWKRKTKYVI
ncbi:MAG: CPBP family intramembrane metalloprotease [Bacteroidales bacterium]|jgi:membrane protease YdiL (CAAX protease family)|nr:CPBP family intramembrane metalloprotease [Bacteroidales bacterium]